MTVLIAGNQMQSNLEIILFCDLSREHDKYSAIDITTEGERSAKNTTTNNNHDDVM